MTAVNTFLQVDLADVDGFTREFLEELQFGQGVTLARATPNDLYMALARTVRQQLMSRWLDTVSTQMRDLFWGICCAARCLTCGFVSRAGVRHVWAVRPVGPDRLLDGSVD